VPWQELLQLPIHPRLPNSTASGAALIAIIKTTLYIDHLVMLLICAVCSNRLSQDNKTDHACQTGWAIFPAERGSGQVVIPAQPAQMVQFNN